MSISRNLPLSFVVRYKVKRLNSYLSHNSWPDYIVRDLITKNITLWCIYHIQDTTTKETRLHGFAYTSRCKMIYYKYEPRGKRFAFERLDVNVKPKMLPYLIVSPSYRVRWSGLKLLVERSICWSIYRLTTRRCYILGTKDWNGMSYAFCTEDKNDENT